jgi:hypothetical protein
VLFVLVTVGVGTDHAADHNVDYDRGARIWSSLAGVVGMRSKRG